FVLYVLIASCILTLFLFTAPATPQIYPLSLHDALPISSWRLLPLRPRSGRASLWRSLSAPMPLFPAFCFFLYAQPFRPLVRQNRSEEHTSELQSRENLVCRLLLEKKKRQRQ